MSGYYVVLNGQVEGPASMTELENLARLGRVTGKTQVSSTENADSWMLWRELRPDFYEAPKPMVVSAPVSTGSYHASDLLLTVREKTAYPNLRIALNFFAIVDLVGAIIFLVLVFADRENSLLYVALFTAALAGLVPLALGNIVVDIADATLRRL